MERRCRLTYETSTECNLVRDNVGVYCASGSFATASLVRSLHALTRSSKQRIKKLHLLANDETVDLWAMDEVHFQQYGSRCRMWIPPEVKDPVLQHHPTRKSVGYFGAVRLRDGKFIFARELKSQRLAVGIWATDGSEFRGEALIKGQGLYLDVDGIGAMVGGDGSDVLGARIVVTAYNESTN